MIAAVANQDGSSGVDELPYDKHQLSITWSEYTKNVIEETLFSFLHNTFITSCILPFFNTLLTPNFNLYMLCVCVCVCVRV